MSDESLSLFCSSGLFTSSSCFIEDENFRCSAFWVSARESSFLEDFDSSDLLSEIALRAPILGRLTDSGFKVLVVGLTSRLNLTRWPFIRLNHRCHRCQSSEQLRFFSGIP